MGFLAFLVQGLPLVGKLTDAFTNYTNKKMDSAVEKYKVDGTVDVEAMRQDTEIIKARTNLAIEMKGDPASKLGRYFFIFPTGIWFSLITYRSIMQDSPWAEYSWVIKAYPGNLEYIPYAVIAYLFVTSFKK